MRLQVSLWDTRAARRAVARLFVAPLATLHAVAVCEARPHLLAAAGSQRGVASFDIRTLKQAQRSHLNKWDITAVSFLQHSPGHCVAVGLDQEVTIAPWEGSKSQVRKHIRRFILTSSALVSSCHVTSVRDLCRFLESWCDLVECHTYAAPDLLPERGRAASALAE